MAGGPDLVEVLDALRHDLVKYLSLPLRMLPKDAPADEVRRAVEQALFETRSGAKGTRHARAIYGELRSELCARGADAVQLSRLDEAVERALAWDAQLSSESEFDRALRARVEGDFAAVARVIDTWLDEASGG